MRRSPGRLALLALAYLALVYHAFAFWVTARGAQPLAPLVVNMLVLAIAIAFLHHVQVGRVDEGARCAACGGHVTPTRSVGGRKLWSCAGCGLERTRQRPFDAAWSEFRARHQ